MGLNHRPTDFQSAALPLSYLRITNNNYIINNNQTTKFKPKNISHKKIQSFQILNCNWSIRYRGRVPRIIISHVENISILMMNKILSIGIHYIIIKSLLLLQLINQ